jgi:hypothetical protein
METIIKTHARYKINEINSTCFTLHYTLIKNGKAWGTFYYIRKGADAIVRSEYAIHEGWSSREIVDAKIAENEARLASK